MVMNARDRAPTTTAASPAEPAAAAGGPGDCWLNVVAEGANVRIGISLSGGR
jgi:hypothetical protein